MKLTFNGLDTAMVTCTCCKHVNAVTAQDEISKTRLEHVFDLVLASIRSQGYEDGYLCPKCEKIMGVDTSAVKSWCQKNFTKEYFYQNRNVKLVIGA